MRLNTMGPNPGAKKKAKRVGRGVGSQGKTCGRGHKGQKSRSGGFNKTSFEGGQMSLQRRVPKFGFNSYKATITDEITLQLIEKLPCDVVSVEALKELNVIPHSIKRVKIINTGELTKKITVKGLNATKGAREKIEALGGTFEG